jgi:hypothetical protein
LPPDATLKEKLKTAKTDWLEAQGDLSTAVASTDDRWEKFNRKQKGHPELKPKSFDWWYKNIELNYLKVFVDSATTTGQAYASLINKTGGGWGEVAKVVNSYSDPSAKYMVPAEGAEDDHEESVYRYLVGQKLDDFIAASVKNTAQKIEDYDKTSERKHVSETSWGGGASYGPFLSFSGSGGTSHIDWHSDNFKMYFAAKGIQQFDIVPGDWYSANLIKMWDILNFQPDGPIARAIKSGRLWGESGIFNLRTATVIVAYEPEIVLSLSKADYERNESHWGGSVGLNIGPFSFGGGAGGKKEDVTFDHGTNSIQAIDRTGVPKIIAVTTDVLPKLT